MARFKKQSFSIVSKRGIEMAEERKRRIPQSIRKILLFVVLLMVFNFFAVYWLFPFFGADLWFFGGKSKAFMFSDLLFLEGAFVFAVGALIELSASWLLGKPPKNPSNQQGLGQTKDAGPSGRRVKHVTFGVLAMVVGACFIGSSIAVGTFF